ncbi:hypothetical protein CPAV1605_161 [seawater metagenome]|uniref:Uncharacterized protein n=1 Tax=seawater metagenome TaxID=1561972 RepID=A0A5E8CIH9_9ZZZZ
MIKSNKYRVIYNFNMIGGSDFEELADSTTFNLMSKDKDKKFTISKLNLNKYPDSYLTILVRWSVRANSVTDKPLDELVITVTAFHDIGLSEIIFFYDNDYWNLSPFIYSTVKNIPLLYDEVVSFQDVLEFLMLPTDPKTIVDLPQDNNDEQEIEDDDNELYEIPNKVKSHHQKMLEHRFLTSFGDKVKSHRLLTSSFDDYDEFGNDY